MLQYSLVVRPLFPVVDSLHCYDWRYRLETMKFEGHFRAKWDMFDTVQLCQYQNRPVHYHLDTKAQWRSIARYGWFRCTAASLCIPPEKVENQAIVCT